MNTPISVKYTQSGYTLVEANGTPICTMLGGVNAEEKRRAEFLVDCVNRAGNKDLTAFLKRTAQGRYWTIDELATTAKLDGLCRTSSEFVVLMRRWLEDHPLGDVGDYVYYIDVTGSKQVVRYERRGEQHICGLFRMVKKVQQPKEAK